MAKPSKYYLILWDEDESVSTVSAGSKSILSVNAKTRRILVNWPKYGRCEGDIVSVSGTLSVETEYMWFLGHTYI